MALTTYRIDRDGAERLLVLIHGWSAEQHHLAAYVPLVDPGERFTAVCPRGPIDLDDGDGASWYERTGPAPDPAGFERAVSALDELVAAETTAAGIGPEHCVIGGFSQGGFLALSLVARPGAPRYGGAWLMCSARHEGEGFELDLGAARGTPALVQYGQRDEIIPPERTLAVAAALDAAGWDTTTVGYDMAHSQTIEMMIDARDWLASVP